MIYFIVFLISIYATYWAESSIKKKSPKIKFYLFSIIAIIIPSALAGVRDSGVGTDTVTYVDYIFDYILGVRNLKELFDCYLSQSIMGSHIEFIYLFLNYIVSLFSKNVNWLYFFVNFITCIFFYMAAYDNRKKAPMWLIMTFFFFLFYNHSYNLVRQSLALSMCTYAFKYVEAKKWIKTIIWAVIIINTHVTGFGFILLFAIHYICNLNNKRVRVFLTSITLIGTIAIFIFYNKLLILGVSIGLLDSKFSAYLSSSKGGLMESTLIMYLLFVVLIVIVKSIMIKRDKNLKYFMYNKIIGILLFTLSIFSKYAYRISFYINVTDCIFIPRVLYLLFPRKNTFVILRILTIFLIIIVWWWLIIVNNENETYPYTSKILEIVIK
jgi:hypothetical protein